MLLRRFTKTGVQRFADFVTQLREDKTLAAPTPLLEDDLLTELISPRTECAAVAFPNRLAAAEYLDALLSPLNITNVLDDEGLWSWLALRFFDQLRPLGPGISLKQLGVDKSRFIPSSDYTDRHRHLLRHPLQTYWLADRDANRALCFLVQPLHRPGDVIEQLGSRQIYSWYKEMLATLSDLIVDRTTMSIKPKAAGKGGGSARRLTDVLDQFDCTWDLGLIGKDLMVPMLPKEFDKFRGAASAPMSA